MKCLIAKKAVNHTTWQSPIHKSIQMGSFCPHEDGLFISRQEFWPPPNLLNSGSLCYRACGGGPRAVGYRAACEFAPLAPPENIQAPSILFG
jgi:hypothetical protein